MKKVLITLAIILALIPSVSFGAISLYGGFTPAGDTGGGWHTGTSFVYTFNVGATSTNPGMFIQCSSRTADDVTGASYNGVAATKIGVATDGSANTDYFNLFYVANPATGAHSVECDSSANVIVSSAVTLYNGTAATQTAITTNAVNKNFTSTQDLTTVVTSTVANSWIVGMGAVTSLDGLANAADDGGVSSNIRAATFGSGVTGQVGMFDSGAAATVNVGYSIHTKTTGGNSQWKIATIYTALEPYVAPAATSTPCRIKSIGICH